MLQVRKITNQKALLAKKEAKARDEIINAVPDYSDQPYSSKFAEVKTTASMLRNVFHISSWIFGIPFCFSLFYMLVTGSSFDTVRSIILDCAAGNYAQHFSPALWVAGIVAVVVMGVNEISKFRVVRKTFELKNGDGAPLYMYIAALLLCGISLGASFGGGEKLSVIQTEKPKYASISVAGYDEDVRRAEKHLEKMQNSDQWHHPRQIEKAQDLIKEKMAYRDRAIVRSERKNQAAIATYNSELGKLSTLMMILVLISDFGAICCTWFIENYKHRSYNEAMASGWLETEESELARTAVPPVLTGSNSNNRPTMRVTAEAGEGRKIGFRQAPEVADVVEPSNFKPGPEWMNRKEVNTYVRIYADRVEKKANPDRVANLRHFVDLRDNFDHLQQNGWVYNKLREKA